MLNRTQGPGRFGVHQGPETKLRRVGGAAAVRLLVGDQDRQQEKWRLVVERRKARRCGLPPRPCRRARPKGETTGKASAILYVAILTIQSLLRTASKVKLLFPILNSITQSLVLPGFYDPVCQVVVVWILAVLFLSTAIL